jgi:hypothetical protein
MSYNGLVIILSPFRSVDLLSDYYLYNTPLLIQSGKYLGPKALSLGKEIYGQFPKSWISILKNKLILKIQKNKTIHFEIP